MRAPFVFDATPLIHLSRIGELDVVARLEGARIVPEAVYDEVVVAGLDADKPGARRVENAVNDDEFEDQKAPRDDRYDRLEEDGALSEADRTVLVLAAEENGTAIMDDARGRTAAEIENIQVASTARVLLELSKESELSRERTRDIVDRMIEDGWYCSPDLYAVIINRIEELS